MRAMRVSAILVVVLLVIGIVALASSAYVVTELEQVVITQFGRPVGKPVTTPGLHFKAPFIQTVTTFEKRIIEWDGEPRDTLTSDKETITVNTTARWKIVDSLQFYRSLRTTNGGQGILDEQIGSAVQKVIKAHPLMEVLRNTQRVLQYTTPELEEIETEKAVTIQVGRDKVVAKIKTMASVGLKEQYGMELVDVQIKQINYPEKVRQKIFGRMRSERRRIKERYEAEGARRKEEIEGEVEREKARLESEGYRISKEIRGKADAVALEIYANAYEQDPEFYSFVKTLETYEESFGPDTHLILTTDSEFFRYLKDFEAGTRD